MQIFLTLHYNQYHYLKGDYIYSSVKRNRLHLSYNEVIL